MGTVDRLIMEWQHAKDTERSAINRRREIEDELIKVFGINTAKEGTETIDLDGTVIKVSPRLDRKVDSAKVQELAAEHGIEHMLSSLFRWTPEINVAVFKAADERIQAMLAPAITIKPGRASFSITTKEK
jgi:hypothetical protein